MKPVALFFFLLFHNTFSLAHGGLTHNTIGWTTWTFSPAIIFCLIGITVLYLSGWHRLQQKRQHQRFLGRWQLLFFIGGLITLVISLLSPIDALSDRLAYVHMIQHTLILMVAAPFFAFASPGFYGFRQLPQSLQNFSRPFQKTWNKLIRHRAFSKMFVAWLLYAVVLWIWHLPRLYEAALQNEFIHDLQHLAFFLTSYIFWRVVIDPYRDKAKSQGIAIVYVFVASLHAMILGVFMTLSPQAWYPTYEITAPLHGMSALSDQQLAGLIMWMPAGISYVVVALMGVYQLLSNSEQQRVTISSSEHIRK